MSKRNLPVAASATTWIVPLDQVQGDDHYAKIRVALGDLMTNQ